MRKKTDLSGKWKFKTDSMNEGEKQEWASGLKTEIEVEVPHIWQTNETYLDYKGAAWYEKTVAGLSVPEEKDIYLCFQAVDFQAHVWWNGVLIGSHEGGFTPFEFKLDKTLIKEKNRVTVRVYDPADNAEIPIGKQGSWYTRVSGIWQKVYLEEKSKVFVTNLFLTPKLDENTLDVAVELEGAVQDSPDLELEYTIRPHSLGEKTWTDGERFSGFIPVDLNTGTERLTAEKKLSAKGLKKWHPSTPYLYEFEVRTKSTDEDIYAAVFGFRKVEQKEGKVFLNNEEVFIRGALDQAFYPDTIYTAPSTEYIINEIKLAKEMGFNLLRKHIKVELPEYLYWADRLGMLIWAEPPNYVKWTPKASERFITGLKDMIVRDYNHPSIIIWSVYNEEWGLEWDLNFDKEKQDHVRASFEKVKKWDETRLICDNSGWSHIKTDINDHHRYFVLPDQHLQWKKDLDEYILGDPDANFAPGHKSEKEPKIISEFGVWGLPDVNKLKDFYRGKEPWWFVNQGEQSHQDDYKRPFTLYQNFEKFGIAKAFGNYEQLASLSQKRMVRAIKSVIEEMRKRRGIAGYVVTEFTDIEWETNGWLDFMRQPKEGFEKLIDFNGPNGIFAEVPDHNVWAGDEVEVDLYVQTERAVIKDPFVRWFVLDEKNSIVLAGESKPDLQNYHTHLENKITFTVPEVTKAGFYNLCIELWEKDKKLAGNEEEFTFSPSLEADSAAIYVDVSEIKFKKELEKAGFNLEQDRMQEGIVITDYLDENLLRFATNGGSVIFIACKGDDLREKGNFTFRKLDIGESWARASSMNYLDTNWFGDLPVRTEMGWEFENILPDYVIPFTDYKKVNNNRTIHMFGNPSLAESVDVVAGYFQGWLGQNGGTLLDQSYGKGRIITTTWKLTEQTISSPIAQQILNQMIKQMENKRNEMQNRTIEVDVDGKYGGKNQT